ncbi:hypothetical protein Hanom_Chr16g01475431 [Helianthus anomalus]
MAVYSISNCVTVVSDMVVGNLMMLYLAVTERSYDGVTVLILSTTAVGVLLLGALTGRSYGGVTVLYLAATYAMVFGRLELMVVVG